MPPRKHDLFPGLRIGRRVIIAEIENTGGKQRRFLCRCDCGKEQVINAGALRKPKSKSCGCARQEIVTAKNTTHGKSKTRLYGVWSSMKARCFRSSSEHFMRYGGRGITVCQEWLSFSPFEAWAQTAGYEEGLTLERVDNNGNYGPDNCKWVPQAEQKNNTSRCHLITFNGETLNLTQWALRLGIKRQSLDSRLRKGFTMEKIAHDRI